MLECMKNRRSIRKYTDQDIPESLLNELLEVATRASNTGNMQLYSVVVTATLRTRRNWLRLILTSR